MTLRGLRRIVAATIGLAVPCGTVLAGLVVTGRLGAVTAFAAEAAITALIGLALAPFILSLTAVQDAIDRLDPGEVDRVQSALTPRLRRLTPLPNALWQSIVRLRRVWRDRNERAETGLAAAWAVFAAVPDPLILVDRHRRVVRANIAAAEFIGLAAESSDLAAALRNPVVLAAADAVLGGEGARAVDFALSVPVERLMRARIAPIHGVAVDGVAAILTLHDITALKHAEQMRADFVANAGHELKTPLATLVGFIETLLGPAREDAAAHDRFLGIMRGEAGRMTRLVDDLLSLSRIELNEHVAPTSRVELRGLIEQVADALELRAAERGVRLTLSLPEDLPDVLGDDDELAQVFQNLIDNAIKYGRPQTAVSITASLVENAASPGALVQVGVTDRGDGIPSEHLPRLTERFYRVDSARSRQLGGTGLGLAIVKHILNRHRGRLDIASTLGAGSTFTVWLQPVPTERLVSVIER
jgi:two-component system phosphate regulon sensor histidine kinase PhoR